MKFLFLFLSFLLLAEASNYSKVKISPKMSYVYTKHLGNRIKIHRIQDINNKITGEYTKRYHPNQQIQPIDINDNIQTIGEVEVLEFIENKNKHSIESVLIDVRSNEKYNKETIPSAVNIPYSILHDKYKLKKICDLLGRDTEHPKNIILFTDGLWNDEVTKFIDNFIESKYPIDKIYYYRGGLQMWKLLGLTTVSSTKIVKEKK